MANEKVALKKEDERTVVAYDIVIHGSQNWNQNQSIYIHANGVDINCEPGETVYRVPVLVKDILEQNVRSTGLFKNGKELFERDYTFNIVKTHYE